MKWDVAIAEIEQTLAALWSMENKFTDDEKKFDESIIQVNDRMDEVLQGSSIDHFLIAQSRQR